jgi:hypothetical protein
VEVIMKATTFFQYLVIFLFLFWPVWALAFVFLIQLFKKTKLFPSRFEIKKPAPLPNKRGKSRLEKSQDVSHASYAR